MERDWKEEIEKREALGKLIHPPPQPSWATVRLPGILHLSFRPSPLAIVHGPSRSLLCPLQSPRRSRSRQPFLAAAPPQPPPRYSPIETARPTTMAFASSLLPVPASRVCASTAPELAAFSPAKKSVSLAAACRRRGPRHGGNPCSPCPFPSTLSSSSALSFRCRSRSVRVRETCFSVGSL